MKTEDKLSYNIYKDIFVLIVMYILQGFPLGLSNAIPQIIQTSGASYKDLALFSITSWAFCIKILWAPIIDGMYIKCVGRRKTWIISTQLLLGLFLIYLSRNIDTYLANVSNRNILIHFVSIFTLLIFFAATQDIAVDGWGINLMPRKYISYASFCNTIGQTIGCVIGDTFFILLTTPNSLIGKYGFWISKSLFIKYVGISYIIITSLILMFKKEIDNISIDENDNKDVVKSYSELIKFIKSERILNFTLIMIIFKCCISAPDSLLSPKLVEFGLKTQDLATLSLPFLLISMFFSTLINNMIRDLDSVSTYLNAIKIKLCSILISMIFIHYIQFYKNDRTTFLSLIIIFTCFQEFINYLIFCSWSKLIALIIDQKYSASQFTFFNTVSNLSYHLPKMFSLYMVDSLTISNCSNLQKSHNNADCIITLDGYHVISIVSMVVGLICYKIYNKKFSVLANESIHHINQSFHLKNA